MKINNEIIDRIAKLALLDFNSDEERKQIKADLEKILNFMNKLNTLDTSDVDPLIYLSDRQNAAGKDEISNVLKNEDVFKNAPDHDGRYFKVPKVIHKRKQ